MGSIEATIVPDSTEQSAPEGSGKLGWKPAAIVSDIATLGTGTMLAAMINIVLVFVVPRLLSVEDYGYWRMFGLYAGYAGFVHLGLADGALLRWAGRSLEEFHQEIPAVLRFMFWQHLVLLTPLLLITFLILHGPLRFVVLALVAYALTFNLVTVLQFALQSARIFRPVAFSTVIAPGAFVVLALILKWLRTASSEEVIASYIAGWAVALLVLLVKTRPRTKNRSKIPALSLAKACIASGWPIVLANTGVMLILYADRLAVSWAATIQNFAQYSLAASAMAVPITAIQACSKVFFSHLAGTSPEARKRIYGISSRSLLLVWAIMLPYYFGLDMFLRHYLPKYMPSLSYAHILLLGIPFLAAIQILQVSYAYLNGMQKSFLFHILAVLIATLGVATVTALVSRSLTMVAWVQVVMLASWWLSNEWKLREMTSQDKTDWLKFFAIFLVSSFTYWVVTAWTRMPVTSVLAYYCVLACTLAAVCRADLRQWIGIIKHAD